MTKRPLVSILLPAFEAAATLPACLASIRRQTLADWECVIVDDGSGDTTLQVARAAAATDPRFSLVERPHLGLVAALSAGLERCTGALVARMDADDIMRRDRLARQAAALERDPGLSAVGCHVRLFPRRALPPRRREYEAWLNGLRSEADVARDAFVECPVAHPTLMMRRDMAALGYRDADWPEDYDLLHRALAAGLRVSMVPERLLLWRDSAGRLSRTDPRYRLERFTACKAHFLARGFLRAAERYVLWGYGATGRALRRALAAEGRLPSHVIEVKAGRIGQRIHGAPVIPVQALDDVRGVPIVVSVARRGPRGEVRAALAARGFIEGSDYVCAA